jgi:hypothetical protein
MRRPQLTLSDGHYIECVGNVRTNSCPYLFLGLKESGHHVASGPIGTSMRDMRALENFLRRSLEAVSGKKVELR